MNYVFFSLHPEFWKILQNFTTVHDHFQMSSPSVNLSGKRSVLLSLIEDKHNSSRRISFVSTFFIQSSVCLDGSLDIAGRNLVAYLFNFDSFLDIAQAKFGVFIGRVRSIVRPGDM